MARLSKNVLPIPSGALGDIVYKERQGTLYIARRPEKYTTPDNDYARKRRSSFIFTVHFSSALIKIKVLNELWKTSNRSAYNQIMKCNLFKKRRGEPFENLLLVPFTYSFEAEVKELNFSFEGMNVQFDIQGNIFEGCDKWISLQGLICLENPIDENDKVHAFIPVFSGDHIFNTGLIDFEISFLNPDTELFKRYQSRKLLLNLLTKGRDGEIRKSSAEISVEV